MDQNDSLMTLYNTATPKVLENLPTGQQTYGPCETLLGLNNFIQNGWIDMSQLYGFGGAGFIAFTLLTRLFF